MPSARWRWLQWQRPVAQLALCAAALALVGRCWGRWSASVFPAPSGRRVAPGGRSPPTAGSRRASQARVYQGPNYVKLLLGVDVLSAMGGTQAGVAYKLSPAGEFYPFRDFSGVRKRVLLLGGPPDCLVGAVGSLRQEAFAAMDYVGRNCSRLTTFLVPRSALGQLIGKQGSNILQARSSTGARIECGEVPFSPEIQVSVSGDADALEGAVRWLLHEQEEHLVEMRGCLNTEYQSAVFNVLPAEVSVSLADPEAARRLVGTRGRTLTWVADNFGVNMTVQRGAGASGESVLCIRGQVGAVHAAHAFVLEQFITDQETMKALRGRRRPGYRDRTSDRADEPDESEWPAEAVVEAVARNRPPA